MTEFAVIGDPEDTELGLAVTGKVFIGPRRLGDVFTVCEGPREAWTRPSEIVRGVRLGIQEISPWPNHLVPEVDSGYNARLLLTGDGAEFVSDGVVLHVEAEAIA